MCDAERAHTHLTHREHTLTREVGCFSLGRDFFCCYILFICDWEAILYSVQGLLLGSCWRSKPGLPHAKTWPQPSALSWTSCLGLEETPSIPHPPSVLQLSLKKTFSQDYVFRTDFRGYGLRNWDMEGSENLPIGFSSWFPSLHPFVFSGLGPHRDCRIPFVHTRRDGFLPLAS